jgi:hypothetical protein
MIKFLRLAVIACVIAVLPALLLANSPGVITTSEVPNERVSLNDPRTNIVLPDDVMITMRVAKFFSQNGIPAYNHGDLAQASTSYLLPIISAPLFLIFKDNVALVIISVLGALSIGWITALVISRRQGWWGVPLALVFLLNSSVIFYMNTGWEHLFEAIMVVGVYLLSEKSSRPRDFVLIGFLSALTVLMRVDAIFLVVPILLSQLLDRRLRSNAVLAIIVFAIVGSAYAAVEYSWFGWLTPTTARLKAGTLPSLDFEIATWVSATKMGSATLLIPLLAILYALQIRGASRLIKAAWIGISINYAYAFVVSDAFLAGRMYVAPLALAVLALSGLDWKIERRKPLAVIQFASLAGIAYALYSTSQFFPIRPLVMNFEAPLQTKGTSGLAQEIVLADYIKGHFAPTDGAIGLFFLGEVSFKLDQFQAADFLGKADEMIARGPVKHGPPGHNKWDIDASLAKWNPAIVPMMSIFAEAPQAALKQQVLDKVDFAFWRDFAANDRVRAQYIFCKPYASLEWGLYVRSDLWNRVGESCQRLQFGAAG